MDQLRDVIEGEISPRLARWRAKNGVETAKDAVRRHGRWVACRQCGWTGKVRSQRNLRVRDQRCPECGSFGMKATPGANADGRARRG